MCLAVPAQVKAIYANGSATVDLAGVERRISLVMTPEAQIGDYVLVHTGFAINVVYSGRLGYGANSPTWLRWARRSRRE